MVRLSKGKILLLSAVVLFLAAVGYIIFNDYGLIRYNQLHGELTEMRTELDSIRQANKRLEGKIDSLVKKIPAAVEKIAREQYEMSKPNETVIKVEKQKEEQ